MTDDVTFTVLIVPLPDVLPAATVMEPVVVIDVLLDLNVITRPPLGAAEVRVTVPVAVALPFTDVGDTVRDLRDGAVIVRVAVLETELRAAVIVAVV